MPKGQTSTQLCEKCNLEISLFVFNRHHASCDGTIKVKKVARIVPEDLICTFCNKVNKNKMSWIKHNDLCSQNINRNYKNNLKNGILSKINSNQYIKAEKLGLPKPVLSEETKLKFSKNIKNKPLSYASLESQLAIQLLLKTLKDNNIDFGETYYFSNNKKEWFLRDGDKNYAYDLCFKDLKVLIEYQGIAFHPKSENDINFKVIFDNMGTCQTLWLKDCTKKKLAEQKGYKIFYIWSDNVKADIDFIVNALSCSLIG